MFIEAEVCHAVDEAWSGEAIAGDAVKVQKTICSCVPVLGMSLQAGLAALGPRGEGIGVRGGAGGVTQLGKHQCGSWGLGQ